MNIKRASILRAGLAVILALIIIVAAGGVRQVYAQGPVWDLIVAHIEVVGFEEDGRIAIIYVEIANVGLEDVPPSTVAVFAEGAENIIEFVSIDAMGPEESQGVEVALELPEDWRGTTQSFAAEVDVNNDVEEDDENNNFASTGRVEIPGYEEPPEPEPTEPIDEPEPEPRPEPQPSPQPAPERLIALLIVVGALGGVAVLGAAITIRITIKKRRRKEWQQKAKEEKPPDTCQPPKHYCQIETEISLKQLNVTRIDLAAIDAKTGKHVPKTIKGDIPKTLNQATRVKIKKESPERLGQWISECAAGIAGEAAELAHAQSDPCHISMGIHLEGIEVTSTFQLYRCVKEGQSGRWKKIDLWKDKRKEERDEPLAMFNSVNPGSTTLAGQMADELKEPVRKFIADYQVTLT